jgi:hypothetical protein
LGIENRRLGSASVQIVIGSGTFSGDRPEHGGGLHRRRSESSAKVMAPGWVPSRPPPPAEAPSRALMEHARAASFRQARSNRRLYIRPRHGIVGKGVIVDDSPTQLRALLFRRKYRSGPLYVPADAIGYEPLENRVTPLLQWRPARSTALVRFHVSRDFEGP